MVRELHPRAIARTLPEVGHPALPQPGVETPGSTDEAPPGLGTPRMSRRLVLSPLQGASSGQPGVLNPGRQGARSPKLGTLGSRTAD